MKVWSEVALSRSAAGALISINLFSLVMQILQCGLAGPFIALKLANEGYSPMLSGLLVSITWGLVIVLGEMTPGLVKKTGVFPANLGSIGVTAAGLACFALFDHVVLYVLGAVAIGVALTVRWISCDSLVIQLSADHRIGRNVGIHETLMGAGLAIGPLMLGLATYGYSVVFCGVIILTFLATGLLYIGCSFFTRSDQGIAFAEGGEVAGVGKRDVGSKLRQALVSAFTSGFIEASFIAFLPAFITSQGYTVTAGAFAGFIFGLGGTLLQPVIGQTSSRVGIGQAQILCVALILGFLSGVIVILQGGGGLQSPVFLTLLFFAGGTIGGANTLAVIDCGMRLKTPVIEYGVARVAAFYTSGAVTGPLIVGAVTSAIGNVALIYASTFFAGLVVLFCLANPLHRR